MKTNSSGAGAMFMKRRAPEPELCHFYDGFTGNCIHEEEGKYTIICIK